MIPCVCFLIECVCANLLERQRQIQSEWHSDKERETVFIVYFWRFFFGFNYKSGGRWRQGTSTSEDWFSLLLLGKQLRSRLRIIVAISSGSTARILACRRLLGGARSTVGWFRFAKSPPGRGRDGNWRCLRGAALDVTDDVLWQARDEVFNEVMTDWGALEGCGSNSELEKWDQSGEVLFLEAQARDFF